MIFLTTRRWEMQFLPSAFFLVHSCQYAKESVALSFLHSFAYEPSIKLSMFQEASNGSEFSQKLNEKGTFRNFSPRLWKRHSNICMQRADYESRPLSFTALGNWNWSQFFYFFVSFFLRRPAHITMKFNNLPSTPHKKCHLL